MRKLKNKKNIKKKERNDFYLKSPIIAGYCF